MLEEARLRWGDGIIEPAEEIDVCDARDRSVGDAKAIRWAAMGLLARREHSQLELKQKLQKRFMDDGDLIDRIVIDLTNEALQSDERFSEAYTRMRYGKGYGPRRILAELRQKGIADELSVAVVSDEAYDWYESSLAAMNKKFSGRSLTPMDRAKVYRFLSYRGFFHDHIQYAIES